MLNVWDTPPQAELSHGLIRYNSKLSVPVYIGSGNNNKLSLVDIQLPD